ncbi:hypothetical protein, partial [Streptomyces sp. NPDC059185]|uniref:hypothetical protein n=1 Tax=Streptomyces sp. NPDC059185 TaxID=3346762 RepID=UPI0036A9FA9F
TLTDDTPAGPGVLRESLRQAVENMPADATGTLLAAELRDLLAASPDSVAEQTLREDLSALLRDTPDMPEGPAEGLARLESLFDQTLTELRLEQLDALASTPDGDNAAVEVWARRMQESLEAYSARHDMPEGEVAYWQEKYRQAGENGFDRTVLADVTRDWNARIKGFEDLHFLSRDAEQARQDPLTRQERYVRLEDALRQEDITEAGRITAEWRQEILTANDVAGFRQTIDEVTGSLRDRAETLGMTPDEWDALQTRIDTARTQADPAELIQAIEERSQRLAELETLWDTQTTERLTTLREQQETQSTLSTELDALEQAMNPDWFVSGDDGTQTLSDETGLWELFQDKKPDTPHTPDTPDGLDGLDG